MILTESTTTEAFVIETFADNKWSINSIFNTRSEAEDTLANLIENNPNFAQAKIVHNIIKTTTDKWLLKHIEL